MKPIYRFQKLKRHAASGLFVALFTVLATQTVFAANVPMGPTDIQISDPKFDKPGVFDLEGESSSIISAATTPIMGTVPGFRAVATVDNNDGELRVCSTVTLNYQIVDFERDWDSLETLAIDGITHLATKDTISWWLYDPSTEQSIQIEDASKQLKFRIPKEVKMPDSGVMKSTEGMILMVEIQPWTMYGSNPASFPDFLKLDDLTKAWYLPPNTASLEDIKFNSPDWIESNLSIDQLGDFPGFQRKVNQSYILNQELAPATGDECAIPELGKQLYQVRIKNSKGEYIDSGFVGDKTTENNIIPTVNAEYNIEISKLSEDGNKYEPIPEESYEQFKNNIVWQLYRENNAGQLEVVTSTGISDEAVGNKDELNKLRDNAQFKKISNGNEKELQTRLSNGTLAFKTQFINSNATFSNEPNFSEQGLKIKAILLADNSIN